jgi:Carboxypeptidase regulatory-like domain
MKPAKVRSFCATAMIAVWLISASGAWAQGSAVLSGTVSSATDKAVDGAKITAKNASSGAILSTTTNADGRYTFHGIAPGDYVVTASASGAAVKTANISIASGAAQTLDLALSAAELPNAPGAAPSSEPSLEDLGFSKQQTQANPQLQAMLTRRTDMLRIHQRLGLITAIPMAAAVITGPMAKAKGRNGEVIREPTQANLDTHIALGGATAALYFSTAYFAMFAPRVPGTQKHGAIRWHEALAWIHGPGMILTPALGIMAYKQENAGEKVHGLASAHGTVADITAIAYGTAIVAVSWPIHWKFWEKP